MNYRLLNEVLIEWNESSKEDSDNTFLKSEDIKKSFDKCFIYKLKLNEKCRIQIFNADWPEFKKYRDKVWIKGKHIELDNKGWTVNKFEPGEYRAYIEDIDKLTDTTCMFYKCTRLVSAFIPNSVSEIGKSMFHSCGRLTSVTIPNSVTTIGSFAFYYCTRLTSIEIPNSVASIGTDAFLGCSKLTSVTIPNSVTTIGWSVFQGCTSLASIEIPNSITHIAEYTFKDCTGMTSVTIPNSVTSIGAGAFSHCNNLKTVYVEDINKFKQINFANETANPKCYGAKLIELKK